MIHECFRTKSGVLFRREALESLGLQPGTHRGPNGRPSQHPLCTGDTDTLIDANATSDTLSSTEAPALTSRDEEERADALSPIHDQLEVAKAWWILEWVPLRHRRQYEGLCTPRHYWSYVPVSQQNQSAARNYPHIFPPSHRRVNLGRPREIVRPMRDGEKIRVHRSVKTRMDLASELEGGKYEPKARFDHRDVEWVD